MQPEFGAVCWIKRGVIGHALPVTMRTAQQLQLPCRSLIELPLVVTQLAGAGHGVDPALGDRGLQQFILIWNAHPAKQQPAAIFRSGGLRCIELKSQIQFVKLSMGKTGLRIVELTDKLAGLMGIEIAFGFRGQTLWTADQDILSLQLE